MVLTEEQLQKIRIYLGEIGFKYIDIQLELLDHVASAVEERMTKNFALTFQDAVNQTQASFGKAGFTKIERSIVKGLSKKYRKLFFQRFWSFFSVKYAWIVFIIKFWVVSITKFNIQS